MALAGVSTLGITFGYGVETTAGSKPSSFTQLTRINSIGGLTVETEQIEASALEDMISRYVAGRGDTGGSFAVTVNLTPETIAEWKAVISKANAAKETGLRVWFETIIPGFDEGFFSIGYPPAEIPQPEIGQNELLTVEMNITVDEYRATESKVEFGGGTSGEL